MLPAEQGFVADDLLRDGRDRLVHHEQFTVGGRMLQIAEVLLKQELRQCVAAREEWLQPWAKAETLAAMRRLQLSLSPNLAGHFFDAAQPALLYLVPACIGASLLTAAARGEVAQLLKFSPGAETESKGDSKKEQ